MPWWVYVVALASAAAVFACTDWLMHRRRNGEASSDPEPWPAEDDTVRPASPKPRGVNRRRE